MNEVPTYLEEVGLCMSQPREAAVRALVSLHAKSALPALEQAREAEKNPELRERMVLAIDRIKNPLP